MSNYRWYQDLFISRVMLRKDCLKRYWKEKFIAGLPLFFTHKVKEELADKNGTINYDDLTYVIFLALFKNLVLACVITKNC